MRFLFVLTELPFPPHRNGVALINAEVLARAPAQVEIDLVVAQAPDEEAEAALRRAAPRVGRITYLDPAPMRRCRVGNLLSGAAIGRNLFELPGTKEAVTREGRPYDATYVAPMMSYVDFQRVRPVLLNAVDSFARLNDTAHRRRGRLVDGMKRRLYARFEAQVLPRVDAVTFVSEVDTEYVRSRISRSSSLTCIPNGVDTAHFRPGDRDREPDSLLFTGNFAYAPNADAALHAARDLLPRIRRVRPEARLYLVGRGSPDVLKDFPGVVVTGFVEDIREYYRRCAVFVCPLRSGAGIKNKVLEAMASGISIVSTASGVEGIDSIEAGRHYLAAEEADSICSQVLRLLESPDLRSELADSARELATRRLTWDHAAGRYYEILFALAGRSRGAP
jgi:glycosyltransferase involved in cell wall biosynthesis